MGFRWGYPVSEGMNEQKLFLPERDPRATQTGS
jgi:hypothetical protein